MLLGVKPDRSHPVTPDEHLRWHRTEVDGRPAVYGVGGSEGPPVVFLHGWALGSRAYKRAIRRLTQRGCRVFAPRSPSFGGTADLPARAMTISGYADWVAAFIDVVGLTEPAVVIGHSFGGGVAIKLAHDRPALVRYLILLNAIGGDTRRPWEWMLGLTREMWPVPEGIEMMQAIRSDAVPNVVRNPLGMMRAAFLARSADLRAELADLKRRRVPVLVLTSDRDGVIPRGAFETVCEAVGTDGRVVKGGHSWLLADPDTFEEVLASTIDVHVAEHEASRTTAHKSEIERLLRRSHLSRQRVRALLDAAGPLWLLSESAATIAGDLVLCRSPVKKNEVRALARRIEGSTAFRVTVVARDRPGLLADSAGVLASSGLPIVSASASTWRRQKLALHAFVVDAGVEIPASMWSMLGKRLRKMAATGNTPWLASGSIRPVIVTVRGDDDRSLVRVVAPDRTGLLSSTCRYFQTRGINIEALRAQTREEVAHDTFVVVGRVVASDVQTWLESPRKALPAHTGAPTPLYLPRPDV